MLEKKNNIWLYSVIKTGKQACFNVFIVSSVLISLNVLFKPHHRFPQTIQDSKHFFTVSPNCDQENKQKSARASRGGAPMMEESEGGYCLKNSSNEDSLELVL